jgi:iron complex outermembrane receptor protein
MMRYWLLCLVALPYTLFAQVIIEGQVLDAQQLSPIPNAEIQGYWGSADSLFRTQTDENGKFRFEIEGITAASVFMSGYYPTKIPLLPQTFQRILVRPIDYQLEEVVVQAYENGRSLLEQASSLTVLGPRELNRDAGLIITPMLNRIPGVFMHSGALNTNRITIRGIGARSLFSTNKLRAYVHDIPLTNGDGETSLEDLDLSLVERVEVIRGPASSMYGAGLGGVINFQLKKGQQIPKGIQLGFQGGSFGLQRYTAIADAKTGNGHLRLNYNRTLSEGYRENNQYDRQSFGIVGNWFTGDKGHLSLIMNWIQVKAFIPSSIDSAAFVEKPRSAAFTWQQTQGFEDYDKLLLGLSYRQELNDKWYQATSIYGGFRNNYELRPFNLLQEQSQQLGMRSRLHGRTENNTLRWQIGVEAYREYYQWATYDNVDGRGQLGGSLSNNLEQREYLNLFTQAEWQITEMTLLTAGLNYNRTRYDYQDLFASDSVDLSGAYRYPLTLSPRLALNHRLSPNWSAFATISHGFSPPSLSETLTPEGQINPDIQPETGWNFEMGSRAAFGTNGQKRLFLDLSLFYMPIRNLLVARRTGNDAFVGLNAGQTDHWGLESSLDLLLWEGGDSRLDFFAHYTWSHYKFADFVDGETDYSGNFLPGVPPHHLNLGLEGKMGQFYGNLNFRFVDRMPFRDDNELGYNDAYSLLNLRLGFRPQWGKSQWDFFGGINNLMNEKYASMILINASSFGGRPPRYYYPGLPRHFYFGIRLGLGS